MSNEKENSTKSKFAEQSKELHRKAHQLSRTGLKDLKDFKMFSQILYKREAKRLERKFGEKHPRVQKWRKRTEDNSKVVEELEVELEITKIDVPETPKEGAKLHGRITDEKNRGISGLKVVIKYNNGKPVSQIDASITDSSGYYVFKIEKETFENIKEKEIKLNINWKNGKYINVETTFFTIEKSDQTVKNVSIDHNYLFTKKR